MSLSRSSPLAFVLVAAGGAVGALLRWAVEVGTLAYASPAALPWVIGAVNAVGAFVLGALPMLALVRRSRGLEVLLGPGLLGGFTTVSSWSGHAVALTRTGDHLVAAAYVALTLAIALLAAAAGRRLASAALP
jgi:CrcB protein